MQIERFEMERTQSLLRERGRANLSESGVLPLRVEELVESPAERQQLLEQRLWYCESDGSRTLRERIAQFYPDCAAANITITNGGSEANYVSLWALLGDQGRLACMLPNYLQGWGPRPRIRRGGRTRFTSSVHEERGLRRWALDLDSLEACGDAADEGRAGHESQQSDGCRAERGRDGRRRDSRAAGGRVAHGR